MEDSAHNHFEVSLYGQVAHNLESRRFKSKEKMMGMDLSSGGMIDLKFRGQRSLR